MVLSLTTLHNKVASNNRFPIIAAIMIFYRRALVAIGLYYLGISASVGMMLIYGTAVILFLIWMIKYRVFRFQRSLFVLVLMLGYYLISIKVAPNEVAQEYFREYALYCMVGAIMISYVREYELMINLYCRFSIIIFLLCAPLPFATGTFSYHNMGYFGSGMVYGDWVVSPCYFAFFLLRRHYKKKWAIIFEILDLILMILFANRSSLLSVALFIVLYDAMIEKRCSSRIVGKWIVLILLALLVCFFLETLIIWVQNVLGVFGISSRPLAKYMALFQGDEINVSYILSGRDKINSYATTLIKDNLLWGIGVGGFYIKTGVVYTHNFFTDAIVSFGIFGGGIIIILTVIAIGGVFNRKKTTDQKLLLLLLLILCFPRLLFSKTFCNDAPYWMFLVFSLSNLNPVRKKRVLFVY